MKMSNKARYAVRALFDIAYHGRGEATQVKVIAERQAVPPRFLEQIFQDLKRANLVHSRRGPRGGYALMRSPETIRIGDVIRALEGPTVFASADGDSPDGDGDSRAITEAAFDALASAVDEALNSKTLAQLCTQAEESNVRRSATQRYVYSI
ncbi:MAG: Rrf2 family transcriptional regulator [Polyangiales bacterium]